MAHLILGQPLQALKIGTVSVATATPPDSETEVNVSIDETTRAVASLVVEPTAADVVVENNEPESDNEAESDNEPATEGVEDQEPPVQRLYQHVCDYGSCPTCWSKYAANQDEQDALETEVGTVPIVQRHVHSQDRGWETTSFAVNCPHMRAFLADALSNYQDLDPDLEGWAFEPPYKALVHRWDRLRALHQELQVSESEPEAKRAVDQLVQFLQPILAPSAGDLAATRETGKVQYNMLWKIFPPGETVLTKFWGVTTVCRVVKYRKADPGERPQCWYITVEHVDWNGERCGLQQKEILIYRYPCFTRVTPGEIRETMIARGRRFQQLWGYHFLNYSGAMVNMGNGWVEQPVTGRVIIDTYAYYRSNNIVKPDLGSLTSSDGEAATETKETEDGGEYAEDDQEEAEEQKTEEGAGHAKPSGRDEDLTELSDEHCLLTTPWLIGFDLKHKQWGRFLLDKLDDIVWNDKAFDSLVLPGGEKELAWEFVESKAQADDAIDDFVPEKGRGIIILMFGPPGVGKTYTAETVAEKARVPLYLMSAGMLGTSPQVVEPTLTHALELCRLWNAMLLLDEADVFLGERLDDSLNRNELVSIFLTKLEYYQGILFLTTNRFSRIDHAFQSRVDLFLPYHDLDASARKRVWHNFFEHFGSDKFDISTEDMDRLAELSLNGREIKNLLKSAQLLNARARGKVTA
ncbi:P-loop containing nucleoside triphosphate hydrolase protein [Parathielavia hyrcaniae]|uniref:P-loop containing nucleoside triphosphate hydrolase protein n=1 Tax=Parathielavia hyrcaniae TaxID=113614 RepID=A0AAN6SYL9_9PEZI|nr:P-loop containing nucleoside triphosphate hydrolase protein [Parathielavia hyrcaniae]